MAAAPTRTAAAGRGTASVAFAVATAVGAVGGLSLCAADCLGLVVTCSAWTLPWVVALRHRGTAVRGAEHPLTLHPARQCNWPDLLRV